MTTIVAVLGSIAMVSGVMTPAALWAQMLRARVAVVAPSQTPDGSSLFLAGDIAEVGGRDPSGLALRRDEEGDFHAEFDAAEETQVELEVTCGTWAGVEHDRAGRDITDRRFVVRHDHDAAPHARRRVEVESWGGVPAGAATRPAGGVTGELRVRRIDSRVMGRQQTLRIWLPPDYHQSPRRRYPVLYMHDGQNLFDPATAFAGEWMLDETATRLIEAGEIEPLIIVGIDHTGVNRVNDYTPVPSPPTAGVQIGGNSMRHARFVVEEVIPLIEAQYRTQIGRDHRTIGGSSLGGLVSLEVGRLYPQTFGRVLAVSPSLWWADRWMLKQDLATLRGSRVYADVGTREEPTVDQSRDAVDDLEELRRRLETLGVDARVRVVADAQHNEAAWADRAAEMLQFATGK